jgi:predicted lipoprotein with Yx(FWY)xxD motif
MPGLLRMAHCRGKSTTRGRQLFVGGLVAGTALVLSPLSAGATTHHTTKTIVELAEAQDAPLGTILTNSHGLTVYTYTQDAPNKSNCSGLCAKAWPPLLMAKGEKVRSLKGVKGIGTIPRGKKLQLTFDRKPLYLFAGDTTPGMTTGQGVANTWFAVVLKAPATVTPAAAAAPGNGPVASTHSSGTSSNASSGGNATGGSSGSSSPSPTTPPATSPPPTTPPATSPPPTTPPAKSPSPPASPSPPPGGGVAY